MSPAAAFLLRHVPAARRAGAGRDELVASLGVPRRHVELACRTIDREKAPVWWPSTRRNGRPYAVFTRLHPASRRIAAELLKAPELLALSSGLLVADIRSRYGCCYSTAARAVGFARRDYA